MSSTRSAISGVRWLALVLLLAGLGALWVYGPRDERARPLDTRANTLINLTR